MPAALAETDAVPATDRARIRDLAMRLRDIAADPIQERRIDLWKRHNALESGVRPMVYLSPEGSWREMGFPDGYEHPLARSLANDLWMRIHQHEHFRHDIPIEAVVDVLCGIGHSGWGLEPRRIQAPSADGTWHHDPVLLEPADAGRLRLPELVVDEVTRRARLELYRDLVGDLVTVRLRGVRRISYHLMKQYTDLRGLDNACMDMYDAPGLIHECMAIFVEGHRNLLAAWEREGLLELNNDNTYHSSGGRGWTDELPRSDDGIVRPSDLWASAESQELAVVGPAQHEEFALRYEAQLLAPFGLNGYGCCEALDDKLDMVLAVPGMRRISISPWADLEVCARRLAGRSHIFSWKPRPTHVSTDWGEDRIRPYLRRTLELAREHDLALEMILKDTHNCEGHPERFDRWSAIAREEVARAGFDVETHPFGG